MTARTGSPRGHAFEGRAAGRMSKGTKNPASASYHSDGAGASGQDFRFVAALRGADGRVAGWVLEVGGKLILRKECSAGRHQLRQPRAWAVDSGVLAEAKRLGATEVVICELDEGCDWTAPIAFFEQHGFPVRRGFGFGDQAGLALSWWRVEDGAQRARQLEIAV